MSDEKNKKIYEIAILGRATWQLHSLNNEGTVGNVTEPRNVRIIDPNTKQAVTTDGISGEMLKHIHTEIMWVLADKSNLCEACKILNPEKFNYTVKKQKQLQKNKAADVLQEALQTCDICDVHGFLIEKPTVSRKSTIEFGWALGVPEVCRDIHTHARHAHGEKSKEKSKSEGEDAEESGISTQMVYHRPTRSGVYAIITVFQPWRIGLNEAKQDMYSYDADSNKEKNNNKRKRRYELALKAYQLLFTRPEGAMTTTRLPHVEDFSGIIVYSTEPMPVPVISPLRNDYINEVKEIAKNLGNSLKFEEFGSISEFVAKISELINKEPYEIELNK